MHIVGKVSSGDIFTEDEVPMVQSSFLYHCTQKVTLGCKRQRMCVSILINLTKDTSAVRLILVFPPRALYVDEGLCSQVLLVNEGLMKCLTLCVLVKVTLG